MRHKRKHTTPILSNGDSNITTNNGARRGRYCGERVSDYDTPPTLRLLTPLFQQVLPIEGTCSGGSFCPELPGRVASLQMHSKTKTKTKHTILLTHLSLRVVRATLPQSKLPKSKNEKGTGEKEESKRGKRNKYTFLSLFLSL